MSLTPEQQTMWFDTVAQMSDVVDSAEVLAGDMAPIRLEVDEPISSIAELAGVIIDNEHLFDGEDEERAKGFLESLACLEPRDAQAMIAELPYEQSGYGLELLLQLPVHRGTING